MQLSFDMMMYYRHESSPIYIALFEVNVVFNNFETIPRSSEISGEDFCIMFIYLLYKGESSLLRN